LEKERTILVVEAGFMTHRTERARGRLPFNVPMNEITSEPDEREIALDAQLIDGLLARDPSLGRVSPKLAAKLSAIGKAEAAKRAPRAVAGPRTSGRRAAVLPLAARASGRVRRAGGFKGSLVWSSAAALLLVSAVAAWIASDGARKEAPSRPGDATVASGASTSARPTSPERSGGAMTAASVAPDRPDARGAASDLASANAPANDRDSSPERAAVASSARPSSEGTRMPARGDAPALDRDPLALPGEDAPLAAEEIAPALAGPLPPLPSPAVPADGAPRVGDLGGAVVSTSPLKTGKVVRLTIGFEAPLALFEGAVIPGGAVAATRGEGGRVLEAKEAKGDALAGVRAAVRRSALVEARAGTSIAFSYFLVQPAQVALHAANETQGRLFRAALEKSVTGKWTRVVVPLADLRRVGAGEGAGLVLAGDLLGSIEVVAGAPGETVRLLIDDIEVTDK